MQELTQFKDVMLINAVRFLIALTTCNSLLGYGDPESFLYGKFQGDIDIFGERQLGGEEDPVQEEEDGRKDFEQACDLAQRIDINVLSRTRDYSILAYLHVRLVFMLYMSRDLGALNQLESKFPWDLLTAILNNLSLSKAPELRPSLEEFPRFSGTEQRPLPEDFAMRGLFWTDSYFPDDWFTHNKIDFDIIMSGFNWVTKSVCREDRLLHLGYLLCQSFAPLFYDPDTGLFSVISLNGTIPNAMLLDQSMETSTEINAEPSSCFLGAERPDELSTTPFQGYSCQPEFTPDYGVISGGSPLHLNMSKEQALPSDRPVVAPDPNISLSMTNELLPVDPTTAAHDTIGSIGDITGTGISQDNTVFAISNSNNASFLRDMLSLNTQQALPFQFTRPGLPIMSSWDPAVALLQDTASSVVPRQMRFPYVQPPCFFLAETTV